MFTTETRRDAIIPFGTLRERVCTQRKGLQPIQRM